VKTTVPVAEISKKAFEEGFMPGIDAGKFSNFDGLLVAVTEKRTVEEMDKFVEFLSKF
jgi:hypothetical protein